jgi:hypothetical protein
VTNALSIADRLDLAELTTTYAAAVDERDWAMVADLFVPAAVLRTPDPPRSLAPVVESAGREQILATVRRLTAYVRTMHHLTGSVWRADGTTGAFGRTTAVAHHVEDLSEPRSWVWHLIYRDRCVRGEDGWRFERRELTVAMIEGRSVLRVQPSAAPPGQ